MPKCPCNEPKIDEGEHCLFCPVRCISQPKQNADTTSFATIDVGDCGSECDEQFPMMNGGW